MSTKTQIQFVIGLLVGFVHLVNGQDKSDELLEIQSQQARSICVYFVDSHLSLTAEQADSVQNLLEKNWEDEFNQSASYMVYNGIRSADECFKGINQTKLQEILDPKQYEIYDGLATQRIDLSAQINWMDGMNAAGMIEDKDATDPIIPHLRSISELELDRLEKLLSLDETQKRKLSIAAKGASREILKRRAELRERHEGDLPGLLQGPNNLQILMEGPLYQLTKSKVWTKSVEKTLTPEQLETFTSDRLLKNRRSINAAVFTIVLGYEDSTNPFTRNEYQGFSDLIEKYLRQEFEDETELPDSSVYFEAFKVVLKIEDEELKACLSDESFQRVHQVLEQARQRAEQYNEKFDDSNDQ